jgi:DNA polymerase/3'-5' exonuclease PolX
MLNYWIFIVRMRSLQSNYRSSLLCPAHPAGYNNSAQSRFAKLFRPPVARLLAELQKTKTIAALDELIQLTPAGLFELMRIKGLGGKKLAVIWHTLKIDTMEALLEACQKNKLSQVPGFGAKTESNIIKAIESYSSHKDHFRYGAIADAADQLVLELQKIGKNEVSKTLWRHQEKGNNDSKD